MSEIKRNRKVQARFCIHCGKRVKKENPRTVAFSRKMHEKCYSAHESDLDLRETTLYPMFDWKTGNQLFYAEVPVAL